jgi:hypothetical protein
MNVLRNQKTRTSDKINKGNQKVEKANKESDDSDG